MLDQIHDHAILNHVSVTVHENTQQNGLIVATLNAQLWTWQHLQLIVKVLAIAMDFHGIIVEIVLHVSNIVLMERTWQDMAVMEHITTINAEIHQPAREEEEDEGGGRCEEEDAVGHHRNKKAKKKTKMNSKKKKINYFW